KGFFCGSRRANTRNVIDRRLNFVKKFEDFLLDQDVEFPRPLVFGEPPAVSKDQCFDLALPCFQFAKAKKLPPPRIASELAEKIREKKGDLQIDEIEATGPYINI